MIHYAKYNQEVFKENSIAARTVIWNSTKFFIAPIKKGKLYYEEVFGPGVYGNSSLHSRLY